MLSKGAVRLMQKEFTLVRKRAAPGRSVSKKGRGRSVSLHDRHSRAELKFMHPNP